MSKAKGAPRTGGRQKGSLNVVTRETREAFKLLVEGQTPRLNRVLARLEKSDPGKYFDLVLHMAEFVVPKLARTELSGPGGEGLTFRTTIDFGG